MGGWVREHAHCLVVPRTKKNHFGVEFNEQETTLLIKFVPSCFSDVSAQGL